MAASLDNRPLCIRRARMSETTSVASAEPGGAAVIPLPNVTEHPERGGRELDNANAVSRDDVVVEPPTQASVELLGSLDVGHGDDVDLQVHIDQYLPP
jgi:hypothetical protein